MINTGMFDGALQVAPSQWLARSVPLGCTNAAVPSSVVEASPHTRMACAAKGNRSALLSVGEEGVRESARSRARGAP